jgi:hypothetical protein
VRTADSHRLHIGSVEVNEDEHLPRLVGEVERQVQYLSLAAVGTCPSPSLGDVHSGELLAVMGCID